VDCLLSRIAADDNAGTGVMLMRHKKRSSVAFKWDC